MFDRGTRIPNFERCRGLARSSQCGAASGFSGRSIAERRSQEGNAMITARARLVLVALACGTLGRPAASSGDHVWTFDSLDGLKTINGRSEIVTYRGRRAVHLVAAPDHRSDDNVLAILGDADFANGTIEARVAGAPRSDAPPDARGFIGMAFRVQPDPSRYENLYLRPTNGRADDQLRRNHSVQYASEPDFPWPRLREESPGKYETYVDLDPGAWTDVKITVSDRRAQLFVNGATQPCLIVNDLKLGAAHGRVALWAHWSTDAYFSSAAIHTP